jgi:hypothetical protein
MSQIIILKNRPKLEITLQEEGFEILDNSAQSNNGIYSYSNLKSVKINKKLTNWFLSIISYIPVGFMGSAKGEIIINKANLKIKLQKRTIKLRLKDADMTKAEFIKQKLNEKIIKKN